MDGMPELNLCPPYFQPPVPFPNLIMVVTGRDIGGLR
jgi:hypothetical protein